MLSILAITFPIFALVGLGYVLTRIEVFDLRDMTALGNFVMYLALPSLLFRATATQPFQDLIDPGFFLAMLCAGLGTQLLMWITLRLRGLGPARRAVGVLGTATPNSAFLAFPIMQSVYPDYAPSILAMCLLVENFFLNPIGLTLIEAANPRERSTPLHTIAIIAWSVIRRPMISGLILGAVVSLLGIPLPYPADRALELLSYAASPIALFFIGGSLVGLPMQGNLRLAVVISAFKLLVHPLVAFGILSAFVVLGFPVPKGDMAIALILSTAMPIFGVFPLLTQNTEHSGAAALSVMISTVAAFFTLTALMSFLV
ncbi:AEC family transporter [Pseudooceanicola sediminis]|nr:AEC family transporter [Pseudooceanicola sediminis]